MKTLKLLFFILVLTIGCLAQGPVPNYSTYLRQTVDANLNLTQTVVLSGTTTGSCYYTCQTGQCQIPGCDGARHTPTVCNKLGTSGTCTTGPQYDMFVQMDYQTTITSVLTPGVTYQVNDSTSIACSFAGSNFGSGGGPSTVSIHLSAYIFAGLSTGRCAWNPSCTGKCSSPHTTNTNQSGTCYTTGPYKQCFDLVVNGSCWSYRVVCVGQKGPGICD